MPDRHAPPGAAIGACFACRIVFVVTPDRNACPFCANPPGAALPFADSAGASLPSAVARSMDSPPAESPLRLTTSCPHCEGQLVVELSTRGVAVLPTYPGDLGWRAAAGNGAAQAAARHPGHVDPWDLLARVLCRA